MNEDDSAPPPGHTRVSQRSGGRQRGVKSRGGQGRSNNRIVSLCLLITSIPIVLFIIHNDNNNLSDNSEGQGC